MGTKNIIGKIDWILLLLYMALLAVGLVNIYAAAFNEAHPNIYDISQNYGKQLMFIGISLITGFVILLIDAKFFNTFAYIFYGISIFLLLFVLVSGTTVAGSKSWIQLGAFSFQPSEFAKFSTALAVAHYLGKNDTDFSKMKTRITAFGLVLLPMSLVLLQGDAGSALVFLVFLLVFYREGMTGLILIIGLMSIILFLLTISFSKWYVIIGVTVAVIIISFIIGNIKKNIFKIIGVYSVIIVFVLGVNFAFNNILKPHQRNRINVILGIEKDTKNVGYNLNQSLTAIGSGGLTGKGFLEGTMTRYKYVPEQHTDFIFCTVGEEHGFLGVAFVLLLYLSFFIRIVVLAERQRSVFSRIYGYGIVSILFFHFTVNIAMTIGFMPVIGIPLPFLSYGGSSLLIFSIMIFVFLKQDANRMNIL